MGKMQNKQLVVCVKNEGYRASLEKRKIYVALRDAVAEKHGMLRIVDESGEDYLYPKAFFRSIALPQAVRKAVLAAAQTHSRHKPTEAATNAERNNSGMAIRSIQTPCDFIALLGGAAASWPFAHSALLNEARPTIEHANLRLIFSEIVAKA
jgi:hypothetical protein